MSSLDISEIIPYNFSESEKKWQACWERDCVFSASKDYKGKKYYVLEMFPYPSGKIHMGHVRNYTLGDTIARFKMLSGYSVLHPIGWDAFGLPAENAALEHGVHPKDWTYNNIKSMRVALKTLGFSYDWSREFATCDEQYYGFQQKIFLALYNKGLLYRKESEVNWDPVDNCVLANEQVIDGKGWRSGAEIEKKKLFQWFLKITDFSDILLRDVDRLDGWPEKVKVMQKNWIGKSSGASIMFTTNSWDEIEVFSTRPDTIFGATFLAISPTHDLSIKLAQSSEAVADFIAEFKKGSVANEILEKQEKLGINTGLTAKHPFSDCDLPVFIANFVLSDYGTGAIFGTPAHDERDFEFATKYSLPIKRVIVKKDSANNVDQIDDLPYVGEGALINSGFLDGLSVAEAKERAIEALCKVGIGARKEFYRLRDWGVSRQRYWGCPIPMIHCDFCGVVPEKESNLPCLLPEDVDFSKPGNPLKNHPTWSCENVKCPVCGKEARRETDTLDTFFDSSWYFLRFCADSAGQCVDTSVDGGDLSSNDLPNIDLLNKDMIEQWMQVDQYVGGIEHAILHLLYARFFTKALSSCGYFSIEEPFRHLLTQGMVCKSTFRCEDGRWLYPEEVTRDANGKFIETSTNKQVIAGRSEKMSKSKKNGVDPNEMVSAYGADAVRLFVVSDSPPERDLEWSDDGVEGCWRFVNRIWRFYVFANSKGAGAASSTVTFEVDKCEENVADLYKNFHRFIKNVSEALETYNINKAVAFIRDIVNDLYASLEYIDDNLVVFSVVMKELAKVISVIMPHLAEEVWFMMGYHGFVCKKSWPVYNEKYLSCDTVTIPVQVNGKLRGTIEVLIDEAEESVFSKALSVSGVQSAIASKDIRKKILVRGKIVNFVV